MRSVISIALAAVAIGICSTTKRECNGDEKKEGAWALGTGKSAAIMGVNGHEGAVVSGTGPWTTGGKMGCPMGMVISNFH